MSGRRTPHDHRSADAGNGGRTEPTLGDIDHLDGVPPASPHDGLPSISIDDDRRRGPASIAPPHGRPAQVTRSRRGWWLPLIALLLVVAIAAVWLNQDKLRALVPHTELNDVLTRADAALKDGRLDGQDGTSARELYEAARALQPDNDRARDGLHAVGAAEVARADAALRAGQLDQARQATTVAQELLGGGSDIDRLNQAINQAATPGGKPDDLIDQAQKAFAAGNLSGADGAGALYQRVLASDPTNAVAAHGLDQVAAALADQIHKAIDANDADGVARGIDQLAALRPDYSDLPALREAQAQMRQQDNGQLANTLKQGQDALRAGRFAGTGDDNALAYFTAALKLDPANEEAKAGLGQVAQALIVQANAALDGGDSGQAAQLLDQAAKLAPKSADLAAARARLATPAATDDATTESTPAPLTPQQSQLLAQTLQEAKQAERRGDIMLPPGHCAYDLYRNALNIDSNNDEARKGLQDLPNAVVAQFNQDLSNGQLAEAGQRLSDLADLSPGDAGQAALRNRLANAWLDQGEQALSSGDRGAASEALTQARQLAPALPRTAEFADRLGLGR